MARILLTGAGGFVGGAVLRRLSGAGHQVIAITSSAVPPAGKWRRLDLLGASADEVAALVEETRATHCIHAAWYTQHRDYLAADVNRDWAAASLRLAEGFAAGGGQRFIGLGTCLEYDQTSPGRSFSESGTPLAADSLYARCKLELFERLSERMEGSSFAWARIFFVYGPGDRGGRLIPYILGRLATGERAEARFGGLERDYVHVDDLASQITAIALSDAPGAFNVGSGRAVRIADMFGIAGELAGRPDLVAVNDARGGGQRDVIEADMSRYRILFGDPPHRPLREGILSIMGTA